MEIGGYRTEAGCARVELFTSKIDICRRSYFLNSETATQIRHNFNGIFEFNNGQ